MKNISNPRWILLFSTLPLLILGGMMYSTFEVVHSQIDPEQIKVWCKIASLLVGIGVISLGYAGFCVKRSLKVSPIFSVLIFILHLSYLWVFLDHERQMIPWSVPQWMLPESLDHLTFAMLMPMLVYSMLQVVIWYSKTFKRADGRQSLLLIVLIPLSLYLFFQVVVPLFGDLPYEYREHFFVMFFVGATVLFFFFLMHFVYQYLMKKTISQDVAYSLRALVGVVFPVLGLALNYSIGGGSSIGGVFGDFSSPWFLTLAFANGLFLMLPNFEDPKLRLFRFAGRVALFPYILYFMLVFLPYLPLGLAAVIIFGLGFLMLTPLILTIMQSVDIVRDWRFLKEYFNSVLIAITALVMFLIIPATITISYCQDRSNLHSALRYVYDDASDDRVIDIEALESTINAIAQHKRGSRRSDIFNSSLPYLTSYYNWIVMDNMTLSLTKLNKLKSIFLGTDHNTQQSRPRENNRSESVQISNSNVNTAYDPQLDHYKTWVDLELTNTQSRNFQEYMTTIDLPAGAWISDYYLYVGDRKEMGILTDRKSANWVYDRIRNTNRDPGLLSYRSDGMINFKVFPFAANEVRRTGFEIIHKETFDLNLDSLLLEIGEEGVSNLNTVIVESGCAVYVSAEAKSKLDLVERKPYFHFIIDKSVHSTLELSQVSSYISELGQTYPQYLANAKISTVNYKSTTYDLDANWKASITGTPNEGGFGLGREIKRIITNSFGAAGDSYPMIVVLGHAAHAVMDYDCLDLGFAYPEHPYYHTYSGGNDMRSYALNSYSTKPVLGLTTMTTVPVRAWPNNSNPKVYLPNDDKSSIGIIGTNIPLGDIDTSWRSGLAIIGEYMAQKVRKDKSSRDWLDVVHGSFESRILTPFTAYIVVETEAQKVVLLRKQKQVLAGNQNLDLGDDVTSMSEPSFWILLILLLCFLIWKRGRDNRRMARLSK